MRLVSWNVNGRVAEGATRQISAVLERAPDIVALQEVTLASYPSWCDALMDAGYSVANTVGLARVPYPQVHSPIRRKYFNLTAATHRLAMLPGLSFDDPERARLAFPEKYLAVRVAVEGLGTIDVHNAHLPPGSTRAIIKMEAFEAIRRRIDEPTGRPRILCGDFNTPRVEDETSVTTWADALPAFRGRWEAAERGILEHPELRDAYRASRRAGEPFPASHVTRGTARRYREGECELGLAHVDDLLRAVLRIERSDMGPRPCRSSPRRAPFFLRGPARRPGDLATPLLRSSALTSSSDLPAWLALADQAVRPRSGSPRRPSRLVSSLGGGR